MAEVELPELEELEEIKSKAFTKRVALTTAIFAVALAITSLGGNNAMKEMILAQQQASDMWAFYQAKVIREHLYRQQKTLLELELLDRTGSGAMKQEAKEQWATMIKKFGEEEKRYNAEKNNIEQEAKKLEHERDINRSKDPYFDYAEVLLQISIVMATIAIIAHSPPIYYFAIGAAIMGALLSCNGFFLIVNLPFFS